VSEHEGGAFERSFERAAKTARLWLGLRALVSSLAVGAAVAAPLAGIAFATRSAEARIVLPVTGLAVGSIAFGLAAHRRRLADRDLALFFDRRLATDEAIATALDLGDEDPARPVVADKAARALSEAPSKRLRPRVLSRAHALLPVAVAALAWVSLRPLPPAPPAPPPAPGTETVKLEDLRDLDRLVDALDAAKARDEAQEKRLAELRTKARDLRDRLARGDARRDLQSQMAELSDRLTAERLDLGSGERTRGFEAALKKMDTPELSGAKRALAERDMAALDDEMQRLAKDLEASSREKAKKDIDAAIEAAKAEGADDVAKALEEQKKRFEKAEKKSERLEEIERALGDRVPQEGRPKPGEEGKPLDAEQKEKLREALEKALSQMSEADRKKLAEELAKQAREAKDEKGRPLSEEDKKALRELAERLATDEGAKELAKELAAMKKGEEESGEAKRQAQLESAQSSLDKAKSEVGGAPSPSAQGTASSSAGANGAGGEGGPKTKKRPVAPSRPVAGSAFRAHASATLGSGAPLPEATVGRAPSAPGETANRKGQGALGKVGPDEIGAVSHSDVPEEYREQVGRYFQP